MERYLATGQFEQVLCGGENYDGARPCHYEWAKGLSDQCRRHNVTFDFIETGTVFVKDGKEYRIPDKRVQSRQAYLSGLSFQGRMPQYKLHPAEGSLFDEPIALRTGEFRGEGAVARSFRTRYAARGGGGHRSEASGD